MTEMLRWTPTLFEAQAGGFSSANRYVRKTSSGGYALASGATVTGLYWFENVNNRAVSWRCKIGAVLDVEYQLGVGHPPAVPAPIVETVTV